MSRMIEMDRTEAEELVDLLENEFRAGRQTVKLVDLAADIRQAFGMVEQPPMAWAEDTSLGCHCSRQCKTELTLLKGRNN